MEKTQQKQNERCENDFLKDILTEPAYNELMDAWTRNREASDDAKEI